MRDQKQLGHLDAILRTEGPFHIVRHSSETARVALQVSRNLCQYFRADAVVVDEYEDALQASGDVISLIVGPAVPGDRLHEHPIEITDGEVTIHLDAPYAQFYEEVDEHGLRVTFIRPLQNGRLELVV